MPKSINPNLVKINRNYTVEEVADRLGVHKNTIRGWVKTGLPVCDTRRPTLILGHDLREFLQQKRQARKRRCKLFELYCMRCRSPKQPAGNMVDFVPLTGSTGRLIGICPDCDTLMNRYTSLAILTLVQDVLDVHMPKALEHINKCSVLPVNSDLR